jgi:YVTN family beta-propeller protein
MMLYVLLLGAALAQEPAPPAAPAAATPETLKNLSFDVFRTQVEPILLKKRPGNVACVTCHGGGASSQLRLQPLLPGATEWNEEQSRKNFEAIARFVVSGQPTRSRFLRHPLDRTAGGDPFHGGGKHWHSQTDPEWQVLSNWVMNKPMPPGTKAVRVIQTNSAGDNIHVIDPATNKVVGVINDIEVSHGVVGAPDGTRIYISVEPEEVLAVVDPRTLTIMKKVKLSGRPNNLTVSKDGRRVYVGIAQQPGAVDVIDAITLTRVKSIPVDGAIHNVYTTPDGKYVVSGSVASSVITVIDQKTEEVAWSVKLSAGIRPMEFQKNPDGSTKNIIVQLSNFHGFVVVDFATHKEIARIEHPPIAGEEAHWDGLQGAPAHGLSIPDGKTVWSTSKVYGYAYIYSLDDWKMLGSVAVGQHPEWVTLTPDGKFMYVAACGDNSVTVIDVVARKEVTRIPVGQAPKRNATALLLTN